MKSLTTAGLLALLAHPTLQSHTIGNEANAFAPTAWSEAVTHARPNASNVIRVPGFDIRDPFPGTAAGWILGANVTASVPIPDSSSFTTAVEVAFLAPPGWIDRNESHHSWSVAQGFYLSSRLRTDDNVVAGDCSSTLSDACRAAWTESLAENYVNGSLGDDGMAPPSECEDELRVDDDREPFDMISGSSNFPLRPSADGKIVRYASGNHSEDDLDDLEEAMRQVWVAGIVFGPSNTSNETNDRFPAARLACVQANQTVGPPPSEWGDGDDDDDSLGMVRPGSAWAAMIVAAGFAAAML